jgi:hypothetical protein
MTKTVAAVAVATGISPSDLLDCDPDVFAEIVSHLEQALRGLEWLIMTI